VAVGATIHDHSIHRISSVFQNVMVVNIINYFNITWLSFLYSIIFMLILCLNRDMCDDIKLVRGVATHGHSTSMLSVCICLFHILFVVPLLVPQ
jgi:hypothetical protein